MLQLLHIVGCDRIQSLSTDCVHEVQIEDRSLGRDAARLLAVGYRIVVDESRSERFKCRDLLSGLVGTVLQQMPLSVLAPAQSTGPGVDWGLTAFSVFASIRQAE